MVSNPIPRNVSAVRYNIHLIPDLEAFVFRGEVEIELEVVEHSSQIVLNAAELTFESAFVDSVAVKAIDTDVKESTVTFVLEKALEKGAKSMIRIVYSGILNDRMQGFYRSKYTLNGQTRYMGVTQFEDTDFRRAVPSQDHPLYKATFVVRMTVPSDRTCLSNMPIKSSRPVEGGKLTYYEFEETPRISTYLVAWAVGDCDYVERVAENGVKVRVYTPVGDSKRGQFALDVACKGLVFFEEFFGIKYYVPKMDLLSVASFAMGAMENVSLITFRETALLCDESSSLTVRQWVALVVLHELGHMWFGNYVTMADWNGLWLNEGFATWAEYLACDHLFPEWNIFRQFVTLDYANALRLAALENAHPVDVEITKEVQVKEIFDAISYSWVCLDPHVELRSGSRGLPRWNS
eukprot:ANDGO_08031.mRNA.1 Aminopeptidase M1